MDYKHNALAITYIQIKANFLMDVHSESSRKWHVHMRTYMQQGGKVFKD